MIKLICEQCKKDFFVSPCRVNTPNLARRIKCCSKKCSNLRKKITTLGEKNSFYGKKHTTEAKRKNSENNLGKVPWHKGKTGVYSKETLQKMSLAGIKRTAEEHPCWKGGRRKHMGYIMIYSPNHPFKNKNNSVREQRLIMEKHLGRYLLPEEVVHHINEIKDDNRIENLMLFKNNSEHMLYHAKLGLIKGRPKKII